MGKIKEQIIKNNETFYDGDYDEMARFDEEDRMSDLLADNYESARLGEHTNGY